MNEDKLIAMRDRLSPDEWYLMCCLLQHAHLHMPEFQTRYGTKAVEMVKELMD